MYNYLMFNIFTLLISLIIIVFVHFSVFTLYKPEFKKVVAMEKPTINMISIKKVTLKKKEVKKVEPIIKEHKKIVKKAKIKVPKKISKKVVKKIVKEVTPKVVPTVVSKVVPKVSKKVIVNTAKKDIIKNEYLSKVRNKIARNKIYPKRAKRLKQEGKVLVSFLISHNGKIKNISLKGKSSYKRLNEAALKLLRSIARFDPIPKELGKNSWAIEVPINYSIINI